ncbi:MAG: ExbD/TolR family protein, partial [Gemmobacter sp.]
MRFPDPPRRAAPEPLLGLINVIFLLLIFVLVVAQLAPPDAVPVTPPRAPAGAAVTGGVTVLVGADGV